MRYTVITALALAMFMLCGAQFLSGDSKAPAAVQPHTKASLVKLNVPAVDDACQDTLDEVKARLPMDYGTSWVWAKSDGTWAGRYFPGRNHIEMSDSIDCGWVPIVATHEWMHQVQDLVGLHDATLIGTHPTPKLEIVAECSARRFADSVGWPHYDSYPETSGVPCTEVSSDVDALLASIG